MNAYKYRRVITFLTFIIFLNTLGLAQEDSHEKFSRVHIFIADKSQICAITAAGINLHHSVLKKAPDGGFDLTAELSAYELTLLEDTGFSYEILIEDISQFYAKRAQISPAEKRRIESSDGLEGFELGSMGGMYTYDEVITELDSMRLLYPHLISERVSVGVSHEGRDLWMVKISDNPDIDEDEPEVFYDALHHSNEPTSMMTVMYYMYHLLENYGSDAEATYLIDNREMYFVPVVNPDGYVYNEEQNPDGGGTWRKNRRDNGFGSYGVDLNRNYGYKWGYDDEGSSPIIYAGNYRGPSAFSEPEIQGIRDFCNLHEFILSLSYHSYSNMLLYPWSYEIDLLTPDSVTFFEYSTEMTRSNYYQYGTPNQTVGYKGNGVSIDWQYGEQDAKPAILAFGAEIGNEEDGSWPPPDRIVPLAEDNLESNLYLGWAAGGLVHYLDYHITGTSDGDLHPEAGETFGMVCQLRNSGQREAFDISCSLSSDDPYITIENGSSVGLNINARSKAKSDTFRLTVSSSAPEGYRPDIVCEIDQGGMVRNKPVNGIIIGTPTVIFADDGENGTDLWDTGTSWGLAQRAFNSTRAFTDSPNGKYNNETSNALTLLDSIDLQEADALYLEFRTRYDIERQYDFGRVQISENGQDWTTVEGYYTVTGGGEGVQTEGAPGYDFYELNWLKEQIDLKDYLDRSQLYIRYILDSDAETVKDGWYIDDIRMLAYKQDPSAIAGRRETKPDKFSLYPNYPNPFNNSTMIKYQLPMAAHVDLGIYNLLGQKVATLVSERQPAGTYTVDWDASGFSSGVYFYTLSTDHGFSQTRKLLFLK